MSDADATTTEADDMDVKAQLATRISDAIKDKRVTQARAAEMIGMPKSKLSGLLRGHFRGVSETKMMDCLTALGKDIEIIVRSAPRGEVGRVHVISRKPSAPKRHPRPASKIAEMA